MLRAKDLNDQSTDELKALEGDKRKELFELIVKRAKAKKIENPKQIYGLRKEIARILTVLRQKELANQEGS